MGIKCVNICGVLSQGNSREPVNLDGGKVAFCFHSLLTEIYYAFNKYRQKSQ